MAVQKNQMDEAYLQEAINALYTQANLIGKDASSKIENELNATEITIDKLTELILRLIGVEAVYSDMLRKEMGSEIGVINDEDIDLATTMKKQIKEIKDINGEGMDIDSAVDTIVDQYMKIVEAAGSKNETRGVIQRGIRKLETRGVIQRRIRELLFPESIKSMSHEGIIKREFGGQVDQSLRHAADQISDLVMLFEAGKETNAPQADANETASKDAEGTGTPEIKKADVEQVYTNVRRDPTRLERAMQGVKGVKGVIGRFIGRGH